MPVYDYYYNNEKDFVLYKLAMWYHQECEAFDRTVCTGPIEHGNIKPATIDELRKINANAVKVRAKLQYIAEQQGYTHKEFRNMVSKVGCYG